MLRLGQRTEDVQGDVLECIRGGEEFQERSYGTFLDSILRTRCALPHSLRDILCHLRPKEPSPHGAKHPRAPRVSGGLWAVLQMEKSRSQ
jgi:hypothetical protein